MRKLGFHKKLSLLIMLIIELMILSSCGKREPSPEKEADVHSDTRLGIVMSGGMNEWLSDGKVALFVDKFYKDPTDSSRMDYRLRFTLKNLTQHIVELHRIEVQFMTSDLVQTVREKLGEQAAREVQPFQQTIQWSSNLGKLQGSLVAHVVDPEETYQFESSGHFFLGKENPSCNVTFYGGREVVAGPFQVRLGEQLPRYKKVESGNQPQGNVQRSNELAIDLRKVIVPMYVKDLNGNIIKRLYGPPGESQVIIEYRYDQYLQCIGAVARMNNHVLAEASNVSYDAQANMYLDETHYSTGPEKTVIYRAKSKFSLYGEKVEEKVVSGVKRYELFPMWANEFAVSSQVKE